MATLDIIVGTWEELADHPENLMDRQTRVIVLPKSVNGVTAEIGQEEAERLLDDLVDIGTDTPAWPQECCSCTPAGAVSD